MPIARLSKPNDLAASVSLTQGAGANIPSGGVGWSRWAELDVTQADQSVLRTSLNYLASIGFIGARWTTPDSDGSGAYFDLVVDGRRCMEFRWGAGGSSEGRCATCEFGTGAEYIEMYLRAIIRVGSQEHWPGGSVKMLGSISDGSGAANGFINLHPGVLNPTYPAPWAFTNIGTANGGVEYRSGSSYRPSGEDEWFEIEVWQQRNTASAFDGRGKIWVGPVGSTTQITDFDQLGGVNPIQNTDEPADIQWAANGVGFKFNTPAPYLGGSPGATLTQDQSIYFATHSIWVK